MERPGARHAVRLQRSYAVHFVEIPPGDAEARHLPGRLAAQVAPLARRPDNVHRHAQRVGHVLEYEIGWADRASGGAEDGVPGFDRSFTMHPRPSACVQDRPGDTSAATRTLTVTG